MTESVLKYLQGVNSEFWDFKVAINMIKGEFSCTNEQAYTKLDSILKKNFSKEQVFPWNVNWKALVKKYEEYSESKPGTSNITKQKISTQYNIESVETINNNNNTTIKKMKRKLRSGGISSNKVVQDQSNASTNKNAQDQASASTNANTQDQTRTVSTNTQEQFEDNDIELNLNQKFDCVINVDSKSFREEIFHLTATALRNGSLDIMDAAKLQKYINGFEAKSLGDSLTGVAAQLLLQDLNNADNVAALKSSVSHIINLVHPRVKKILEQYIKDEKMWACASTEQVVLPEGLSSRSNEVFNDIIKMGKNNENIIQSSLLEIAIYKKKIELLESEAFDSEQNQLLDILSTMVINISNCGYTAPDHSNTNSEMSCYRQFAGIMDIVLRKSPIYLTDGEHVCKASKEVIQNNKRFEESTKKISQAFGSRIDMILTGGEVELSAGEWKKEGATISLGLNQQTKNVRVSKVLLTKLFQYPLSLDIKDGLFCLGLDFTGAQGYMFYVKQFEDVYIAKPLSGLKLPQPVAEIANCYSTIDNLFKLKNYNENLLDLISPAVAAKKQEDFLKSMLYYEDEDDIGPNSPNVFFTPPKKRHISRLDE